MAVILPGLGNPEGGSVGGLTYARNRYGRYVRARTNPVNPNSSRQNVARQNFRAAVEMWGSTLTSLQRGYWNNWAAMTPWLNKAGETVYLTGQSAWIRHACAQLAGFRTLTGNLLLPPVQNDVGSIDVPYSFGTTFQFDPATQTFDTGVSLPAPASTNSSGVTDGIFLVEISTGHNAGQTFPSGRFAAIHGLGTQPPTWTADTIPIDGAPVSVPWSLALGQYVFFRVRGIGDGDAERRVTTQVTYGPVLLTAVVP